MYIWYLEVSPLHASLYNTGLTSLPEMQDSVGGDTCAHHLMGRICESC